MTKETIEICGIESPHKTPCVRESGHEGGHECHWGRGCCWPNHQGHHASCKPNDTALIYRCEQCGLQSPADAEQLLDDYKSLLARQDEAVREARARAFEDIGRDAKLSALAESIRHETTRAGCIQSFLNLQKALMARAVEARAGKAQEIK